MAAKENVGFGGSATGSDLISEALLEIYQTSSRHRYGSQYSWIADQ